MNDFSKLTDRQHILFSYRHDGPRSAGTSIYFLLEKSKFVAWHKHLSEEAFYWHLGGPMRVSVISKFRRKNFFSDSNQTANAQFELHFVGPFFEKRCF